MDAASVGFRFHPNEEELINHFLVLKLTGHDDLVDDVIGEIDVFRREPSDLPDFARIRSDDPIWYFFCYLEKKYSNGKRVNRRTIHGVWKLTGSVREIKAKGTTEVIGTQKKMVFYYKVHGSKDIKTDWVIHEYQHFSTLNDPTALVLCKLKNKADAGLPLGDEGEAGFSVASDDRNRMELPTFLEVEPDELQFHVAGDTVDLSFPFELQQDNLPDFSDDEEQGDPIKFADSILNVDESDIHLCYSIGELQSSKPFLNSSEGQTSASQHRQMKANNGDDIYIMGADAVHSSRVSNGETNCVQWLGEEFPGTSKLQHQPESLNITAKDVISPKARYKLQMGSAVIRKEGKAEAKLGAINYGATSGIQEVDEEISRISKPQKQVRFKSDEVKVSRIRKPQRQLNFTSKEVGQEKKQGAPVDLTRKDSLRKESGKEKKMLMVLTAEPDSDLSSEGSTSNDRKGTLIRPKTPPSSQNPGPPLVYLTNIVIGLTLGIFILWDMLH